VWQTRLGSALNLIVVFDVFLRDAIVIPTISLSDHDSVRWLNLTAPLRQDSQTLRTGLEKSLTVDRPPGQIAIQTVKNTRPRVVEVFVGKCPGGAELFPWCTLINFAALQSANRIALIVSKTITATES
jgi:hypothetical protein